MKQMAPAEQMFEESLKMELQYLDEEIRLLTMRKQAVLTVLETQSLHPYVPFNDLDVGSVENPELIKKFSTGMTETKLFIVR